VALALASPAIAHADGCTKLRIGTAVAGGTALALIASGASLAGVAYGEKQNAHDDATLGNYNAAFREADRLSAAGQTLIGVGLTAGAITGLATAIGFSGGRGTCHIEAPRVTPASAGFQVHF
jgi:hypothetical protein